MALELILLAGAAGVVGGAMNSLAGGGTFATLPALLALGLPSNISNATSNAALLPGAASGAWAFRRELVPIAGIQIRLLSVLTFIFGLIGSYLLVVTPSALFEVIIPWLLLFAFIVIALGERASAWLHDRFRIGRPTVLVAQCLLGIYGGYFGGGVGLITTALYGLLAQVPPRELFALRTAMLATANLAAALIFLSFGMVAWWACLPMMLGSVVGGWLGAGIGKTLSHRTVRLLTLLVTAGTTTVFFLRAYD